MSIFLRKSIYKMIYLLFLFCLFEVILSYKLGRRSLIQPSFLVTSTFTLSSFFYIINIDFVGVDVSIYTLIVITLGLFGWIVGEFLIGLRLQKSSLVNEKVCIPFIVSRKMIYLACAISSVVVILDFQNFMSIGRYFGSDNIFASYAIVRGYSIDVEGTIADLDKPRYLKILDVYIVAQNYLLLYYYVYNVVICSYKKCKIYILPFVLALPTLFFTTARTAFIEPVLFVGAISIMMNYSKTSVRRLNMRYIKITFFILFISVIVFKITGDIRGGAFLDNGEGLVIDMTSLNRDLCIYLSSPIRGLDVFLTGENKENMVFGGYTFAGLYDILRFVGFDIQSDNIIVQQNFQFGNYYSNVYTGFKAVIQDFTVVALLPYSILLGYICGYFYYSFKRGNFSQNVIKGVVLGRMYYAIVLFYFSNNFHMYTQVVFIIFLVFLFFLHKIILNR